jgi:hypothetical protein
MNLAEIIHYTTDKTVHPHHEKSCKEFLENLEQFGQKTAAKNEKNFSIGIMPCLRQKKEKEQLVVFVADTQWPYLDREEYKYKSEDEWAEVCVVELIQVNPNGYMIVRSEGMDYVLPQQFLFGEDGLHEHM